MARARPSSPPEPEPNPRRVVAQAMALEVPERQPVSIHSGGAWLLAQSGLTFASLAEDPDRMAGLVIHWARQLRSDIVYVGSGYNNAYLTALGCRVLWRDPAPPQLAVASPSLGRLDPGCLEWETTARTVRLAARRVVRELGQEYPVAVTLWAPFTLAALLLGLEDFLRALIRRPDLVQGAMSVAGDCVRALAGPLLGPGGVDIVSLADPLASGSLICREHFARFALPGLQGAVEGFHARGAAVLAHFCGYASDRLDLIGETGADIISLGAGVSLRQAKAALAGKACLGGNLSTLHLMRHTAEAVAAEARECLAQGGPGGGFILMPDCDLSPLTPRGNVEAFLRAAHPAPLMRRRRGRRRR